MPDSLKSKPESPSCGCNHGQEESQHHNHLQHSNFSMTQQRLLSVLCIALLLFITKPYIIEALRVRVVSYASYREYDEAIRLCQKILFLDKKNIKAWTAIGYAYIDKKETENAKQAFLKVLEINPNDAEAASFELGRIYFENQNFAKALVSFERISIRGEKFAEILDKDILNYRHGAQGLRQWHNWPNLLRMEQQCREHLQQSL